MKKLLLSFVVCAFIGSLGFAQKLLTIGDLELTDDAAIDEISRKHIIKKGAYIIKLDNNSLVECHQIILK